MAKRVIADDDAIDETENRIEGECIKIIALHQPVALDLRWLAAIMKINSDLERVADLAADICERALRLAELEPIAVPCMATRPGEPLPDVAKEEPSEVKLLDEDAEPIDVQSDEEDRSASRLKCRGCGSTKIIRNVAVVDQGERSDGKLKVKVFGNPEALIFKDRLFGEIWANICGSCGLMDFYVSNPSELYERVRK